MKANTAVVTGLTLAALACSVSFSVYERMFDSQTIMVARADGE